MKKTIQPLVESKIGPFEISIWASEVKGPRGKHLGWNQRYANVEIRHEPLDFEIFGQSYDTTTSPPSRKDWKTTLTDDLRSSLQILNWFSGDCNAGTIERETLNLLAAFEVCKEIPVT